MYKIKSSFKDSLDGVDYESLGFFAAIQAKLSPFEARYPILSAIKIIKLINAPFCFWMAININCKKKWHPSRYETQIRVREAEEARERIKSEGNARRELGRREALDSEINKLESGRMRWML